jgi:hypothetical protein
MKKTLILALASVVAFTLVLSTGCKKKNPFETMMNYNIAIAKILKDNVANCEKAVTDLSAFVNKNKASMDEARKAISEATSKQPSEEETKANAAKAQEIADTMNDFAQKCPEKMQKVGEIFASLFTPTP